MKISSWRFVFLHKCFATLDTPWFVYWHVVHFVGWVTLGVCMFCSSCTICLFFFALFTTNYEIYIVLLPRLLCGYVIFLSSNIAYAVVNSTMVISDNSWDWNTMYDIIYLQTVTQFRMPLQESISKMCVFFAAFSINRCFLLHWISQCKVTSIPECNDVVVTNYI